MIYDAMMYKILESCVNGNRMNTAELLSDASLTTSTQQNPPREAVFSQLSQCMVPESSLPCSQQPASWSTLSQIDPALIIPTCFYGDVSVASRGQESVSVASQGLCFMRILQRHDQTSRTDLEANPQSSEGHHTTHRHTNTNTQTPPNV
jgi:hypothetical protein